MQMSLTLLAMQKGMRLNPKHFVRHFRTCLHSLLDLLQTGRVKVLLLNIIFL